MKDLFLRILTRTIQYGFSGWIVSCFCIATGVSQAGSWEGFQPATRYAMEAPVVCFSQNKAVNSKLSGIAVGTNGIGAKIFRGINNGVFQNQTAIPGGFALSIDMNYFNHDTIPDIVVPSYFGGNFTVYLGASDGSFVPGETYQVDGHCTWVTTADFNEDGKIDIAAAHNGSGQPLHLYIYLGNGDGTFTRFQKYPTQFATPTKLILADVNNDSHIDIAYSLSGPDCGVLFLGNGDGTFQPPALIAGHDSSNGNGNSQGFSLADINADGNIDWIGAQDFLDIIMVRLGDGTGKFVPHTSLYLPHAYDIETTDINGDGTIDIIASNLDSVVCFLQDQRGTFSPSAILLSGHGMVKLLAHDIDNDGQPDIIVSNLDSAFSVAINKGNVTAGVGRIDGYLPGAALFQNYPNPFNPSTTIKYELPGSSEVTLTVFDILGREVSVLVNKRMDGGVHEVRFDGSGLASGIYFYRIHAEAFVQVKKFLLIR
jgi:hypothetical protein